MTGYAFEYGIWENGLLLVLKANNSTQYLKRIHDQQTIR
jgi:hypothetical protein